jgi:hypothetical protein
VLDPTANPVTVKEPVVLPLVIVKLGGSTSTIPLGLDDNVTATPVGGAGAFSTTLPFMVCVSPTVMKSRVTVITGFETFTVAVPKAKPDAEAVIVVLPAATGVTRAFAPVAPAPTVTFVGTVATPGLLLLRLTIWPFSPAGAVSNTDSVPWALVLKSRGLGVSVTAGSKTAVINTVAGLLLTKPSFTMSCTT